MNWRAVEIVCMSGSSTSGNIIPPPPPLLNIITSLGSCTAGSLVDWKSLQRAPGAPEHLCKRTINKEIKEIYLAFLAEELPAIAVKFFSFLVNAFLL